MVDNICLYNSLNTTIGTIIKNPEMLKNVPYYLKTKKRVTTQLKNYLIY